MRKSYSIMLVIVLFLGVSFAQAQGYTFRVLANKGDNKVKRAGQSTALDLKTGATLNAGDELVVGGDNPYIGLMHKTGKTIEVRTAGTQKVSEIEKKLAAKNTSVTSKYAQYIADKMNDGGNTSLASRSNATGAVSRALVGGAIPVKVPDANNEVFGDYTILKWGHPEDKGDGTVYNVKIQDIFDEVIYSQETTDTMFKLVFDDIPNETGLYLVTIELKEDPSIKSEPPVGIKRVVKEEVAEVTNGYEDLQTELNEETALNKLIYASFFEENGLILDAMTKYEEAIALSPEVEDFQELYKNFLITNGIEDAQETSED